MDPNFDFLRLTFGVAPEWNSFLGEVCPTPSSLIRTAFTNVFQL